MFYKTISYFHKNCNRLYFTKPLSLKDVKVDILKGAHKGIIVIAINRPAFKNAVNLNVLKELSELLDDISADEKARVVVFRSFSRGVFCSGADLKERITMTPNEVGKTVKKFQAFTNKLESLPIPVIAALDGIALGGGFEIALACDIRIGTPEIRLGLVETKLAIIPGAGGTQRLPRIVCPSIAKELIFTGRIINGQEAKSYSIINHLVEQNEFFTAAYDKALQLSQEILPNGPIGVKMAKSAINNGLQVDLQSGCAIEESCYAQVIPTKDRLEGLKAFLSKRKPEYIGE